MDLKLLSTPQTSNCRTAATETIGSAKACWAGGALQVYLNVAGRDPVGGGFTQITSANVAATVTAIRDAFKAITDTKDWTHDGQPEGWKVIDRTFTKAEARYIPNGPELDLRHGPSRRGPATSSCSPTRRTSSMRRRPGTLIAPSAFFGQHGYVPDVQDLADNVNMRATFLAGGRASTRGPSTRARSTSRRPSRSCSTSPSRSTARVA